MIEQNVGKTEHILKTIKRRNMRYFGHVMRHDYLHKTITQDHYEGKEEEDDQ